jgi:hypothetical protein
MGRINCHVITAVVVIGGAGVVNAWGHQKPAYRLVVGAMVFLLVLSLLDAFGGAASSIASGLAMLAMVYGVINLVPFDALMGALGSK